MVTFKAKRMIGGLMLLLMVEISGATPALLAEDISPAKGKLNQTTTVDSLLRVSLNVKDFGAVGDGKADDTEALQKAFDAARTDWHVKKGYRPEKRKPAYRVIIPAGNYRVTRPLKLTYRHNFIHIQGIGGIGLYGGIAPTSLIWDGPEEQKGDQVLLDIWGLGGLQLQNLSLRGRGKAAVLLRINNVKGHGAGGYVIDQVMFENADTGIEIGGKSRHNSDTMTFRDVRFARLKTGFRTMASQNVGFLFLHPSFYRCDLALHFKQGGNAEALSLFAIGCREIIRIDSGGINNGTFQFSGMRIDVGLQKPRKKPIILRARGETNVKFSALDVICQDALAGDKETPCFILGPHANVVVESSMITGKIAVLKGNPKGPPTWIQFDNCRFRVHADPRTGIDCDEASGFEVRNCVVNKAFLPRLVRYPSQTVRSGVSPTEALKNKDQR